MTCFIDSDDDFVIHKGDDVASGAAGNVVVSGTASDDVVSGAASDDVGSGAASVAPTLESLNILIRSVERTLCL